MSDNESLMITIHKLDARGEELWRYNGQLLEQDEGKVVLEAAFDRDDVEIEGLVLQHGDRFIEHFYFERWYNIFEIYSGDTKRFKGWYCNIARPAWLDKHDLYAEDLALDLVVLPDKQMIVVDQDDFEQLNLPRIERKLALAGLDELIQMARDGASPFEPKDSHTDTL